MTDSHLMDADCIHGSNTWWECPECEVLDLRDNVDVDRGDADDTLGW